MSNPHPWLRVRFDGGAVGPGSIPVSPLLQFLVHLNKVLQRVSRVLQGEPGSARKGSSIRDVELKLVSLAEGSPAAVLGFERKTPERQLLGPDMGQEILECAIHGLATIQNIDEEQPLPIGYDTSVLTAWRDAGKVIDGEIDRISFTLRGNEGGSPICLDQDSVARIRERIASPRSSVRTVEGRLLMADFRVQGTRCRIHPSVGSPVLCLFSEEQKDEVFGLNSISSGYGREARRGAGCQGRA